MSAIAGRVLLIPKGAYNALTTYNPLDFVTYGADSYVCKQTSTGNAPTNTTYWQLLAKGSTDADQIGYDNTASGLSATDVQAAVDELASEKQDKDLSTPIVVEGVSKTTVEGALSGLNTYADNIKANITNPNLLDNPWFTVNQRGWTSGTSTYGKYCLDRWFMSYGSNAGTVTADANGIKLTPATSDNVRVIQKFEDTSVITNKPLTGSVMLSDGTIYSGTATHPSGVQTTFVEHTDAIPIQLYIDTSNRLNVQAYSEVTIRAVKLELGSYSTLHLDAAPDYATELLKCQRYERRIKATQNSAYFAYGYIADASSVYVLLDIGAMRTTPNISAVGTFYLYSGGSAIPLSYSTGFVRTGGKLLLIFTGTGLTVGASGMLYFASSGDYIDLDAEL